LNFNQKLATINFLKLRELAGKNLKKKNPKRDEKLVKKKHQEICEILEEHRSAIESRKLVVYLIDECHLLWGDVCGYRVHLTFANTSSGKLTIKISTAKRKDRRNIPDIPLCPR
jgi:hypothetical protein